MSASPNSSKPSRRRADEARSAPRKPSREYRVDIFDSADSVREEATTGSSTWQVYYNIRGRFRLSQVEEFDKSGLATAVAGGFLVCITLCSAFLFTLYPHTSPPVSHGSFGTVALSNIQRLAASQAALPNYFGEAGAIPVKRMLLNLATSGDRASASSISVKFKYVM